MLWLCCCCLIVYCCYLVCGVLCLIFVLLCSYGERRDGCFTLIVVLVCCDSLCSVALLHGVMGRPALCDCWYFLIILAHLFMLELTFEILKWLNEGHPKRVCTCIVLVISYTKRILGECPLISSLPGKALRTLVESPGLLRCREY